MKSLIGKKFGKLEVVEYFGKSRGDNKSLWKCQCDCGNTAVVRHAHLTAGNTKSCGCLSKRKGKDSPLFKGAGELPLDFYSRIKRNCHRYGKHIEFNVTIEYLWELFLEQNRKCALSGEPLVLGAYEKENRRAGTSKITASLDRIDSLRGYVDGNVQWVHKTINVMKNDMGVEEFKGWCKKVSSA